MRRRLLAGLFLMLLVGCAKEAAEAPASSPVPPTPKPAGQIPREASKWRAHLTREVRFWWGLEEPRDTFFAQVHQESRWRPDARSPVGAGGLAQFMPTTAAWIAKLYPKDLQPADAYDPKWALRALVKYDHWIWQKFSTVEEGNERWGFTLASYNAGLGWIAKERRAAGDLGRDPGRWFGTVEDVCLRAARACAESRGYSRNIWFRWRPLYAAW